jgi:hypothetical protein
MEFLFGVLVSFIGVVVLYTYAPSVLTTILKYPSTWLEALVGLFNKNK